MTNLPIVPTQALLTTAEYADLARVSPETVRHWRKTSYGPKGVRVGRHVRYRAADVAAFLGVDIDRWLATRRAATP